MLLRIERAIILGSTHLALKRWWIVIFLLFIRNLKKPVNRCKRVSSSCSLRSPSMIWRVSNFSLVRIDDVFGSHSGSFTLQWWIQQFIHNIRKLHERTWTTSGPCTDACITRASNRFGGSGYGLSRIANQSEYWSWAWFDTNFSHRLLDGVTIATSTRQWTRSNQVRRWIEKLITYST